jgi:RNA polymerase sigma-70 factor (ECF subfamily)
MDPQHSFEVLMHQLRAGQDAAAAEVFQRFARRLILLARSKLERALQPKVDPEDILQSVFRSFFGRHAAGQFDVSSWDSLWSLLTVITIRKCANKGQHFRRGRRNVQREVTAQPTADESLAALEGLSREPTPDEAAELTDTVEQVMRRLDEREREILALSLQGMNVRDISGQIGYAERTVRRSLEHIKKLLQELDQRVHDDT